MSNGSELKSRAAFALRAAGYFPAPRLWLNSEQLDLLHYMARQNAEDVNRIRAEALQQSQSEWQRKIEIEKAWAMLGKGNP